MSSSKLATLGRAHGVRAAAAIALILGYADLVRGGVTASSLLLVLAYLVIVPAAIVDA